MDAERFSALLRPIRDAALAFEVDVSAELEEYIDQCVRSIGPVDETNLVNFAEAGLLLQGSALILGRKVEHLHALVYKALEKLKTQQRRRLDDDVHDADEGTTTSRSAEADLSPSSGRPLEPIRDDDPMLRPGKNIDAPVSNKIRRKRRVDNLSRILVLCAEDQHHNSAGTAFAGAAWRKDGGFVLKDILDLSLVKEQDPQEEEEDEVEEVGADPTVDEEDLRRPQVFDDGECDAPPPVSYDVPPPVSHDDKDMEDVDFEDPYAEIDMHEPFGVVKPVKRGKFWQLPEQARRADPPRRKRQRVSSRGGSVGAKAAIACAAVTRVDDHSAISKAREACRLRLESRRGEHFKIAGIDEDLDVTSPEDPPRPNSDDDDDDEDDDRPPAFDDDNFGPEQIYEDRMQDDRRISTASSTISRAGGDFASLARRVAAWQEQLEPLLKSREERAPFDAKRTGRELAADLKEVKETKHVPFAALTSKLPRYEVCRRFLAALQLANDGKVSLHHTNGADVMPTQHDFKLTLTESAADDSGLGQISEEDSDDDEQAEEEGGRRQKQRRRSAGHSISFKT